MASSCTQVFRCTAKTSLKPRPSDGLNLLYEYIALQMIFQTTNRTWPGCLFFQTMTVASFCIQKTPNKNLAAHRQGYTVTTLHMGNDWATL